MKEGSKRIAVFILLLLLASCGGREECREDYHAWYGDPQNKMRQEKHLPPVQVAVQYMPAAVQALELHGLDAPDSLLRAAEESYGQMSFYRLSLNAGKDIDFLAYGGGGASAYEWRYRYYSFRIQSDIWLEAGGQRYPCIGFHAEPPFRSGEAWKFMLGFEAEASGEHLLSIEAEPLDTGPLKFRFANFEGAPEPPWYLK